MPDARTAQDPSGSGRRNDLLWAAGAALAVFVVLWPVARQGMSLLDDGVWLVGAERLAAGDLLYRDVFTIYGPARFVVLAAMFVIAGTSAVTMALLETIAAAVAAGVGTFAARRLGAGRLAPLVAVAAVAVGLLKLKIVWAAVLAVALGLVLRSGWTRRSALALGAVWGTLAWFGFDALVQTIAIPALTWIVLRLGASAGSTRRWIEAAVAAVLVAIVPLGWAFATGTADTFVWNTVVYPVAHFRDAMGISIFATLADGETLGQPFATLLTQEVLGGVWPGHGATRALGLRLLALALIATPIVALLAGDRRRPDPLRVALGAASLTALTGITGRGDETHLVAAALPATWLAVAGLAALLCRGPLSARAAAVLCFVVVLGPLVGERVWLATHADRPTLARWDRPRAGLLMERSRVATLERAYAFLEDTRAVPTSFWPYQPAMNFVYDVPLGHRQITLLGGEVRDADALVRELRRDPIERIVLAERFALDGRRLRELVPPLWTHLRTRYRVVDTIVRAEDPAWVLEPVPREPEDIDDRLPDHVQSVANDTSPDLADGHRVMQTFTTDGHGLEGLYVRWRSGDDGFSVPVDVVLWDVEDGEPTEPRRGFRIEVEFEETDETSLFRFGEVEDTADREIGLEIRLPEGAPAPVRLYWHEHDVAADDQFPDGEAYVDGEAVEADLYFASY